MATRLMSVVIALVLLFCPYACAEEDPLYETYTIINGTKEATFSYPQGYTIEDEDPDIAVFVRLNEVNYITVSIPRKNKTGAQQLLENIGDEQKIIQLTDDVHVFGSHGDKSFHPMLTHMDIVEVGIDLGKHMGVLISTNCLYGQTEIYEAAMVIVESLTGDTVFSEWLTETWIPYVSRGQALPD